MRASAQGAAATCHDVAPLQLLPCVPCLRLPLIFVVTPWARPCGGQSICSHSPAALPLFPRLCNHHFLAAARCVARCRVTEAGARAPRHDVWWAGSG